MDDHLRPRRPEGLRDPIGIKRISHHWHSAQLGQHRLLGSVTVMPSTGRHANRERARQKSWPADDRASHRPSGATGLAVPRQAGARHIEASRSVVSTEKEI